MEDPTWSPEAPARRAEGGLLCRHLPGVRCMDTLF